MLQTLALLNAQLLSWLSYSPKESIRLSLSSLLESISLASFLFLIIGLEELHLSKPTFVCFAVKTVHLEVVFSLSTDSFWPPCDALLLDVVDARSFLAAPELISLARIANW